MCLCEGVCGGGCWHVLGIGVRDDGFHLSSKQHLTFTPMHTLEHNHAKTNRKTDAHTVTCWNVACYKDAFEKICFRFASGGMWRYSCMQTYDKCNLYLPIWCLSRVSTLYISLWERVREGPTHLVTMFFCVGRPTPRIPVAAPATKPVVITTAVFLATPTPPHPTRLRFVFFTLI